MNTLRLGDGPYEIVYYFFDKRGELNRVEYRFIRVVNFYKKYSELVIDGSEKGVKYRISRFENGCFKCSQTSKNFHIHGVD